MQHCGKPIEVTASLCCPILSENLARMPGIHLFESKRTNTNVDPGQNHQGQIRKSARLYQKTKTRLFYFPSRSVVKCEMKCDMKCNLLLLASALGLYLARHLSTLSHNIKSVRPEKRGNIARIANAVQCHS